MKITGKMNDISHLYTNLCPTKYEFYEFITWYDDYCNPLLINVQTTN